MDLWENRFFMFYVVKNWNLLEVYLIIIQIALQFLVKCKNGQFIKKYIFSGLYNGMACILI